MSIAKHDAPKLTYADSQGNVFPHESLSACGMKAGRFFQIHQRELIKLPSSSEIFLMPNRMPVGWHAGSDSPTVLMEDPYETDAEVYAVAAFIPPGHTIAYNTAYEEKPGAPLLPLFAYAPLVEYRNDFYVPAFRVDLDMRHDEDFMDQAKILANTVEYKKKFPNNRLVDHLTNCATVNFCGNAKNFFLGRIEAPIPTSPVCNAQCQGCISFQPPDRMSATQKRIQFVPTPEEIAELALFHMEHEANPLVSFGQGCEGEPTLQADVIEKSIRLIRQQSSKGIININTNAGRPDALKRLFDAGLNNIRVSTNSVREPYYSRYYQPRGYSFKDVTESVDVAKRYGALVSMNYLSMPGFTDSVNEFEALQEFIGIHGVDMVQWRNLNYDPLLYFKDLGLYEANEELLGMRQIVETLSNKFPNVRSGYFNPRQKATHLND